MKKLTLFLFLFLGGCYTQYNVVEPQRKEVVVVRNEFYHTPYSPIYPYSLYRWEYYSRYYPYERYYLTPEYRWYYIYHASPQTTTPQTRRSSGVTVSQPRQRGETRRTVEVNEGGRRETGNVRRGSERTERGRRTERKVE